MTGASHAAKPAQFRLPVWAKEFLNERAKTQGTTRTQVVLEALECLRSRETERLMEEGYREMADENRSLAEQGLLAAEDSWPEW